MELSLELKRADILVRLNNYQKTLQDAEKITFNKETIQQDYAPLKVLRNIKKQIDEIENPYTKDWKEWNEARNSILSPVENVLNRKTKEYSDLAEAIKKEQDEVKKENERINGIRAKIVQKKIDFSQDIAAAQNLNDLVKVESLIGLEKTRPFYQEYKNELIAALDELVPLIKEQKARFKELTGIDKSMETVTDERTILSNLEKKDDLQEAIERAQKNVQHLAINSSMNVQEVEAETMVEAPKGRKTVWKWEVIDINQLKKAFPLLVQTIPNKEALDQLLRDAKKNKTIKESNSNGLRIYQETLY